MNIFRDQTRGAGPDTSALGLCQDTKVCHRSRARRARPFLSRHAGTREEGHKFISPEKRLGVTLLSLSLRGRHKAKWRDIRKTARQTGRRDRGVTLSRLQTEQPPPSLPPAAAMAELSLTSLIPPSCWSSATDSLSSLTVHLQLLFPVSSHVIFFNPSFFYPSHLSLLSIPIPPSLLCICPHFPLLPTLLFAFHLCLFPLLVLFFYVSFSAHPDIPSLSPSLSRTLCLWSRYRPLSHHQTVVLRGRCGSPGLLWTGTEWHSSTCSRYVPLVVFDVGINRLPSSRVALCHEEDPALRTAGGVHRAVGVPGLQRQWDRSSCASKDPVLERWSAIAADSSPEPSGHRAHVRFRAAVGTWAAGLVPEWHGQAIEEEGVLGRSSSKLFLLQSSGACAGASPPLGATPRRQRLRLVPTWRRLPLRWHHRGDRSPHRYSERTWALSVRWFEHTAACCRRGWRVNGD